MYIWEVGSFAVGDEDWGIALGKAVKRAIEIQGDILRPVWWEYIGWIPKRPEPPTVRTFRPDTGHYAE